MKGPPRPGSTGALPLALQLQSNTENSLNNALMVYNILRHLQMTKYTTVLLFHLIY